MLSISASSVVTRLSEKTERLITSPVLWWVLLVCGVAVRFRQYLFAHSYWYDEAFFLLPIRERNYAELLGPQPYNLVIPPMFLWVARALFEIGGDGELVMRLPAFVAGVTALLLMPLLARRVVGDAHAVWAVAFLVVSRNAISHGCEVRPYTMDLLLTIVVIYCVTILTDQGVSLATRRWATISLGVAAAIGPWLSFPSAFVLGGASLALAVLLKQNGKRRDWLLWIGFNGLVCMSAILLWWFSARHMYYDGMIEHWGHRGWGGFPDWSNPWAIAKWIASRPMEIGNYGNREVGIVLSILALIGGFRLARNSKAMVVMLLAPFGLALIAALVGKYPMAHRTNLFLLPSLWLLAACGISGLVAWGRHRGWELAFVGIVLIAWDAALMTATFISPDRHLDYRAAYRFVQAHRKPSDLLWSQTAVVYQTYYGKAAPVLMDHQFDEAAECSKRQRLWVVLGNNRQDLRQRLEANGGRIALQHPVNGLDVLLLEPK